MKSYSFPKGGLQFNDPFAPSGEKSSIAHLPGLFLVSLDQHSGREAIPLVEHGKSIAEGELVGKKNGLFSANIHSPLPGRVLRTVEWLEEDGEEMLGLLVRLEGSFNRLGKREDYYTWEDLKPQEIRNIVEDLGIVEMEGIGQPVSDMFDEDRERAGGKPLTLVLRCVFDDPWLAADYTVCSERLLAVAEGLAITFKMIQAERIILTISTKEKKLTGNLESAIAPYGLPYSICYVGNRYPQRNRRELEIALNAFAKDEEFEAAGYFIISPSTSAAIRDAVKLHKPIIERYVAIGGSGVRKPQVLKARIGMRIADLFDECGGLHEKTRLFTVGSPYKGRKVKLDEPVTKTTNAVCAYIEEGLERKASICAGCGECRTVCPVGLDPERLYKHILAEPIVDSGELADYGSRNNLCHGCGCCDLVCPSRLPLSDVIVRGAAKRGAHD
ncbi:MAG: SLBB domain-containing protein [Spirochaetaceae bacterium]|jgi:electron transport complex protein RnfC|nr:SLBB domain-containing protein [Spirochaetaceae bacterium]